MRNSIEDDDEQVACNFRVTQGKNVYYLAADSTKCANGWVKGNILNVLSLCFVNQTRLQATDIS